MVVVVSDGLLNLYCCRCDRGEPRAEDVASPARRRKGMWERGMMTVVQKKKMGIKGGGGRWKE